MWISGPVEMAKIQNPPAFPIPCWGLGVRGGNVVTDISLTAVGRAGIPLDFPGRNSKGISARGFN